jgi:hypothetical protein
MPETSVVKSKLVSLLSMSGKATLAWGGKQVIAQSEKPFYSAPGVLIEAGIKCGDR